MTDTRRARPRWTRCATAATSLLVLPALAAGCASSADNDAAGSDGAGAGGDAAASSTGGGAEPVVDGACPGDLAAGDLGQPVHYPDADVDGDGAADSISIGTVDGGGVGCPAALVVTTADGAAATALPGLELVPPTAFVPGGAAAVDGQALIAAPVSFSPRGGGEVGLFALVDGVLTPVQDGRGHAWTILSTVDDGGGLPQSIDCGAGGLTHTELVVDALGEPVRMHQVQYSLDGTQLSRTGVVDTQVETRDAAPAPGLSIFATC